MARRQRRVGVRVRLLGPFEVLAGGRPVAVTSERLRSLLAVLAMSAPEWLSAEVLGQRIWGDAPPAHVRRSVQTLVARLRRVLGDGSVASGTAGYRLIADPAEVDVLRFGELLDSAASAGSAPDERDLLEEAIALWRGAPFEGIRADWLQESAAHPLQERYLSAVERRIDLDLAADQHRTLVAELRELTARYPLRESLWTRLLIVLDRSGRPAEALAAYDAIRTRLAAELGVDPGAELREIYTRLLAADTGAAPTIPVPRQLPPDVPHFTGRSVALAALDALLPAANTPPAGAVIAAIDGAGGTGKTALAVHWAHRVRDRFPDGQLYLNLRGYGPGDPVDPAAALDSLLRSMAVPGDQIPAGIDARSGTFRSRLADRRMLLVLDNARDAAQVRPLLPGSSTMVLVTSRNQLRGLAARESARRIDLDELSPDEAVSLLVHQLSRSGSPDAAWADHLAGLGELARLCGHLPLALVIAAERAGRDPGRRPRDLVAEIRAERHRLDAFDSDDDPVISVRSVFSWSYRALDADTARMFRLLALHPGPDISRPAAAALAGVPDRTAGRLLTRLVETHLVEERRPGRHELHDLLRRYASELVERDGKADRDAALERGLDWYVHSAVSARRVLLKHEPRLKTGDPLAGVTPLTFADVSAAQQWFDAERGVLLASLRAGAARGQHAAVCRLAEAMSRYLSMRRADDELASSQQIAAESARLAGDPMAEGLALTALGRVFRRRRDYAWAAEHFDRALELFELAGDESGEATVLREVAVLLGATDRLAEAVAYHERAIEIFGRHGETSNEANELNSLADTLVDLGHFDRAAENARASIELGEAIGHSLLEPYAWDTLGKAYVGLGRDDEAVVCFQRAIKCCRQLGDRWIELMISINLGRTWSRLGTPGAARTCFLHALRLFDELGAADSSDLTRAEILALVDARLSAG